MRKYSGIGYAIVAVIGFATLTGCEPEAEEQDEDTTQWGDTTAVKSGKGFTEVAVVIPEYLQSIHGSDLGHSDSFDPAGLTRVGDQVTMASWQTMRPSQYSVVQHFEQYQIDVTTGDYVKLEKDNDDNFEASLFNPNDGGIVAGHYGYQRGTDDYYIGYTSFDNWGTSQSSLNGDIEYYRHHSFARRPRVANNGMIVEDAYGETYKAALTGYNTRINAAFKDLDDVEHQISASRWVETSGEGFLSGVIVPLSDTSGHFILLSISKDSLFVSDMNAHTYGGNMSFDLSYALPQEWEASNFIVRLTDDESKFGFAFGGGDPFVICSGSYEVATQQLVMNNEGVEIPNMSTLINHDIDTDGNFFFDNYGDSFNSETTISIYKASGNSTDVVGQDDLLDGGSIKWLRVINGKVHAIVGYTLKEAVSGVTYHRCALIIED